MEETKTQEEYLSKILREHWFYIYGVLDAASKPDRDVKEIEYHYKSAFRHGWKHAIEWVKENNK